MKHNVGAGTIMSNQSLVLQGINRNQNGNYCCIATNAEGQTHSNLVPLSVMCKYISSFSSILPFHIIYRNLISLSLIFFPCSPILLSCMRIILYYITYPIPQTYTLSCSRPFKINLGLRSLGVTHLSNKSFPCIRIFLRCCVDLLTSV